MARTFPKMQIVYNVRIPVEVYTKIEQDANNNNQAIAEVIRNIVVKHYEQESK